MPIYEYKCLCCGTEIEKIQSSSDPPLKKCIRCGGKVKKVYHPAGLIFKGSGFYSTDSRKSNNGEKPESKKEDKIKTKSENPQDKDNA